MLDIVLCHNSMPENLNLEEWHFLESLTKVLTPMKEATEIMSGDLNLTISQCCPIYFGLMSVLYISDL